ncbi:putative B3 domain-containing protein At3g24850 [Rhododendron vialii]|uniref:putative B3 domain-containing protein At3g24850 n=1 Tax=Rhododendron vialii TaxID=182163 RepID=UPI00265F1FAB|nr:putative B3 domain-containing protein At3g24850 [Rhododendron vialii]
MDNDFGYDYSKLDRLLKETKEWLLQLDSKKRLNVVREILKNPHYDESDVYILCLNEYQIPSDHKPPEPRNPFKIRFVMSGRQPTKPVREDENADKKTEKTGRKRPRGSSDCEFGGEEEKYRAIKKRANMKKVNNLVRKRKVVLPEITPDLPDEFKERIRNLGGAKATLVIQKVLEGTDVSANHGRLSLPRGKLVDKEFPSGEGINGKDVAEIEARLIAENGKEHEIDIRQWNMKNRIYNVVKGWNEVVKEHKLCKDLLVQLWSFRVEGNLWFALVKLWKVKEQD